MKEPLLDRIAPLSKKDRVVKAIREAIVSGGMKPGDPLVENRLARQLGVGQPLVREALLELEHQGFVQRVPYRGTSVTRLGPEEIEQIQNLRIELEGLAVEWARTRAKVEEVAELRRIVDGMRQATTNADLSRFNDHDLALHRRIWELAGNKYLYDALERTVVPLLTSFYLRSGRVGALHADSIRHHETLVELVASRESAERRVRDVLAELKSQSEPLVHPTPLSSPRYRLP
jgi:DNA-binding GntR family transcriptional regulator